MIDSPWKPYILKEAQEDQILIMNIPERPEPNISGFSGNEWSWKRTVVWNWEFWSRPSCTWHHFDCYGQSSEVRSSRYDVDTMAGRLAQENESDQRSISLMAVRPSDEIEKSLEHHNESILNWWSVSPLTIRHCFRDMAGNCADFKQISDPNTREPDTAIESCFAFW
jgi:hypothetical protein